MQTGVLKALKWYQQHISAATPAHCRYFPTCSNYTIEAVQRFGVVRGLIMGGARILRCHPFVRGGFDFVPSHFSLKRNPQPGVTDRLPK